MDQLLAKIREAMVTSQQADEARTAAQLIYYRAVETAHEKLAVLQTAEHELLVQLLGERQLLVQQQQRAAQAHSAPVAPPALPTVVEETPSQVADPAVIAETPPAEPQK